MCVFEFKCIYVYHVLKPSIKKCIYMCMCMCVCVCIYTHTHILLHAHIYIYAIFITHTYMHAYIHTYIHACMHACMHTYIQIKGRAACEIDTDDALVFAYTYLHKHIQLTCILTYRSKVEQRVRSTRAMSLF